MTGREAILACLLTFKAAESVFSRQQGSVAVLLQDTLVVAMRGRSVSEESTAKVDAAVLVCDSVLQPRRLYPQV